VIKPAGRLPKNVKTPGPGPARHVHRAQNSGLGPARGQDRARPGQAFSGQVGSGRPGRVSHGQVYLPLTFFTKFWSTIKGVVVQMFRDFFIGTLNMSLINFGAVSLIPKVLGATDIRQFSPITMINVLQCIFLKECTMHLAQIADRLIHP